MTLEKVKELEAVVEPVSDEVVVEAKKPFCDKCDSKGRFHKSGCPNKV